MWGDSKFTALSKPQPNGQTLWVYLLTGPHTTALPGAFVAGEAHLAEALNWPLSPFRKVFTEVLAKGLVLADPKTRLIFIPKAVIHNTPESPNVVKAWRSAFDELPDCQLKVEIYVSIKGSIGALGLSEAYAKAFGEAFALSDSVTDSVTGTRTDTEKPPPSADVVVSGTFSNVKLTIEEVGKLNTKYGTEDAIRRIDELSEYMKSTGRKYPGHYATILAWDRRNGERRNGNGHAKPENPNDRAAKAFLARALAPTVQPDVPDVREKPRRLS